MGVPCERVRAILPSVDADPVVSPAPSGRIGILGRLDPVKGHETFLEAASQVLRSMPDVRFLVAGKEANVSVRLLKNQARQLRIERSVDFLGYLPDAPAFLRSCSFGVVASIGSEAVSRACQEWMAVGRAVVGTLVGSLPELIETQETGLLVPPGDAVAMGDAMLKLLREPDIAARYGRAGHAQARARYSPETHLAATLTVYRSAIDLKGMA